MQIVAKAYIRRIYVADGKSNPIRLINSEKNISFLFSFHFKDHLGFDVVKTKEVKVIRK